MEDLEENDAYPANTMSYEDEKVWAMLAHLSILLNLVTGILGPLGSLAIYLVYKDRSRYVAFQSMQAFIFQLVFWVGGGLLVSLIWIFTGLLSIILIGLLCIPLAILVTLIPVGAIIYGVVAGIQTYQGDEFRYWLIADWAEKFQD